MVENIATFYISKISKVGNGKNFGKFFCITKISHKKKVFLQGHRLKMKNQEACKFEFCIKATIFKKWTFFLSKIEKKIYFWNFEKKCTLKRGIFLLCNSVTNKKRRFLGYFSLS
jgi:hypothetical protein